MPAKQCMCFIKSSTESEYLASKINLRSPMASAVVRSKAVVMLFFIHCLLLLALFVSGLCLDLVLKCNT